jgi:zinc-ribbon domain
MQSRYIRWVVLAALGGLGIIGLILAASALLRPVGLLAGATAAMPISWIVPLGSLFVIVGVTWLLLSQAPSDDGADATPYDSATCPSCGRLVMVDWRLCPYCGAMMPDPAPASDASSARDRSTVANG